ncbi:MAG: sensor histidine kinase [Promethearchaeota archaeon]
MNIINKQVMRGIQIISNVKNVTNFDDSNNSLQPIDVLHLLKTSIEYIESSFPENNIKINFNYSSIRKSYFNGLYVQGDKLLQNVFENIIFNAIYHNKNSNIQILINVSKIILNNTSFVKIEFIDNGVGITNARKKSIFQKEYEIRECLNGMGFGLTLVKKLIKKYNGYIWVEDKVKGDYKKGSNFIILIPEINEKPYILA